MLLAEPNPHAYRNQVESIKSWILLLYLISRKNPSSIGTREHTSDRSVLFMLETQYKLVLSIHSQQ